jgi:WD40 repeat protein
LEGHEGDIYCVAVLPDGRVVSGSWDNTLRVWDLDSGEQLQVLEGHTGTVFAVAALPNGQVVSGSGDGTVRVWDFETGAVQEMACHERSVPAPSVLPADQRHPECNYIIAAIAESVIVAGPGKQIKVWTPFASPEVNRAWISDEEADITAMAVLTTGQVVTAHDSGVILIRRMAEGGWADATTLRYVRPRVKLMTPTPNGGFAFVDTQNQCYLWRRIGLDWCEHPAWPLGREAFSLAALPDGQIIVGGQEADSTDGLLEIWGENRGQPEVTIRGLTSIPKFMVLMPGGFLAVGQSDGMILGFRLPEMKKEFTFLCPDRLVSLAAHPREPILAAVLEGGGVLALKLVN